MSETTDFASTREWVGSAAADDSASIVLSNKLADFGIGNRGRNNQIDRQAETAKADMSPVPLRPLGGRAKRLLDLVVSITALILAAPLMAVVAIILRLSGGPVFFVHQRIGFDGKAFGCLKFRSMVVNPDAALKAHLAENADAREEWALTQKLRNDPRITAFGHALRRSSVDELPQLLNIVRGEMSCVGPRPITEGELDRYGPTADLYLKTRPGLTGLWQTSGRGRLSYEDRVMLDTTYINEWSLGSDLRILFRTIFAVLRVDETS